MSTADTAALYSLDFNFSIAFNSLPTLVFLHWYKTPIETDKGNHIAHILVSELFKHAASHPNKWMPLLHLWEAEEDVGCTEQKVHSNLENCCALHKMSTEHPWDKEDGEVNYCTSLAISEISIRTYSS